MPRSRIRWELLEQCSSGCGRAGSIAHFSQSNCTHWRARADHGGRSWNGLLLADEYTMTMNTLWRALWQSWLTWGFATVVGLARFWPSKNHSSLVFSAGAVVEVCAFAIAVRPLLTIHNLSKMPPETQYSVPDSRSMYKALTAYILTISISFLAWLILISAIE